MFFIVEIAIQFTDFVFVTLRYQVAFDLVTALFLALAIINWHYRPCLVSAGFIVVAWIEHLAESTVFILATVVSAVVTSFAIVVEVSSFYK